MPVSVLDDAQLVVSEFVTNGACHSGGSADDALTLRVDTSASVLRLAVGAPAAAVRLPDGRRAPEEASR